MSNDTLAPERWNTLIRMLELGPEVPPNDREALFRALCPDDAELRDQAHAMIRGLEDDPNFMSKPASGHPGSV